MEFVNVPGLVNKINKRNYPSPALKTKTHLSPTQSPMFIDGAVDAPRDTTEPPKVGDDRERDDCEEGGLGALREEPSREDEVVEHVRGHQNGKVERRELSYR